MKPRLTMWLCAVCLSLAAMAAGAHAQEAPAYIPVQGFLTDDADAPRDGSFVLELRLYALATGGVAFYAESQNVSVDQGLFTVYLGDGTAADLGDGSVSSAFDLAMFNGRPQGVVFLGITVDGDVEMSPRLQFGAVPFAGFSQMCGDAATLGGVGRQGFANIDSSGKLPMSQVPDLSSTYALQSHAHPADDLPALDKLNGKITTAQLPSHTHAFSDLTGTLSASQVPNLGGAYVSLKQFQWGRTPETNGPSRNGHSVYSQTGTPEMGSIDVTMPRAMPCPTPIVVVSPDTGGTGNFIVASTRLGRLTDSSYHFTIDWISLYAEQGTTIAFDWFAYCP